MKRYLLIILLTLLLTGCSGRQIVDMPVVSNYEITAESYKNMHLRVGLVPGAYAEIFTAAIQPSLEELGYIIEIIYYDNYQLPNISLARGLIDLNIYQHYKSLNSFKFENDLALSAIAEIPTLPMGIFSSVYKSIDDIETNAVVSVPMDYTNRARALALLEDARLITFDKYDDKNTITETDIVDNPLNLRFNTIRAENLVRSLSICELSVIDGSYAINGGLSLSDALYTEELDADHLIVIAVRTEDLSSEFVRDIIDVVHSDKYMQAIINPDGTFANFQRPRSFIETLNREGR